jgi:cytochrome oxidase Cu insertion factor (SCO1/SenC/PrrC family)
MKWISLVLGFALHQVRALFHGRKGKMLSPATAAPDFTLRDQDGNEHRLSSYRGHRVVLWWYIRASTPG